MKQKEKEREKEKRNEGQGTEQIFLSGVWKPPPFSLSLGSETWRWHSELAGTT